MKSHITTWLVSEDYLNFFGGGGGQHGVNIQYIEEKENIALQILENKYYPLFSKYYIE